MHEHWKVSDKVSFENLIKTIPTKAMTYYPTYLTYVLTLFHKTRYSLVSLCQLLPNSYAYTVKHRLWRSF